MSSPKYIRLLLSFFALLFGVVVLSISLLTTSSIRSYGGGSSTSKSLYFDEAILPDHLLYPLVAVVDRLVLVSSSSEKQVQLMITFGQIRLEYAWGLLTKAKEEQALIALSKSQKYLNQAGYKIIEDDLVSNQELVNDCRQALKLSIEQTGIIMSIVTDTNKDLVYQLNMSNKELLKQLKNY